MRHISAILVIFLVSTPVFSDAGWLKLTGPEITQKLSNASLVYDGARQSFFESGRTLYDAGEESWGYWRVSGDRYCSQWPPHAVWECYDLEQRGEKLRFVSDYGTIYEAEYAK